MEPVRIVDEKNHCVKTVVFLFFTTCCIKHSYINSKEVEGGEKIREQ